MNESAAHQSRYEIFLANHQLFGFDSLFRSAILNAMFDILIAIWQVSEQ